MAAVKKPLLEDYHLLSYDVLDSTNEEAKRLADGGASHGAVIWAKRQTDGKGRMGRDWVSPEGNLYVSVLLSPDCTLQDCSQLSFVAAVATLESLKAIIPPENELRCKWPNDILLNGRKLGGILLEAFTTQLEGGGERQWVAVGVGVNVDSYPENVRFPATCVRESGVELVSAKIILSRFISNFIHCYDVWAEEGFEPLRAHWLDHAYCYGEPVEVHLGDEACAGVFTDIDSNGRMELTLEDESVKLVSAGEVIYAESD